MGGSRCALGFLLLGPAFGVEQPFWGCGLLGNAPGINADGSTSASMQKFIDGLKVTNKYNGKLAYWNWNYAPEDVSDPSTGKPTGHQYLTKDFLFMPENWGVGVAEAEYIREANVVGFADSSGVQCPAQMADIFLGANEPDIYGSCMGDMMGACTAPCTSDEVNAHNCPVASLDTSIKASPNSAGHCDCWSNSHATGVGFWPVDGVTSAYQPLPTCFEHPDCVSSIMGSWRKTAANAVAKGYKFLSAPLLAVSMDWMRNFVEAACNGCSDMSCGCPTHVGWHFYANDCQPELGGYDNFQLKLDKTVALMEEFPHLQGAIVNEVGMLNCAMNTPDAICIPNGPNMKYPALSQPNHACPSTPALPNGLGTFIEHLLGMAGSAKTKDGRRAIVSFTWFNLDMAGGTYNLQLFDNDGTLNSVGEAYISACQAWADGTGPAPTPPAPTPAPAPGPTPGPSPAPTPAPAPGPAWNPCSSTSTTCCNPNTSPKQICPSGAECQACGGGNACECGNAVADVMV